MEQFRNGCSVRKCVDAMYIPTKDIPSHYYVEDYWCGQCYPKLYGKRVGEEQFSFTRINICAITLSVVAIFVVLGLYMES